ncbi:folylpolyglutamate synthase/dihydrofolate synthase family protein [uncultured Dialister sp.]|uniref:bifunctional folylpolyglutamate synthase/dihydrofolate synthase n=1 Tax=uncultured Dialister sp. TaxID=278064 RepID=UPI00266FA17D|nr:folylpolyglutamate synthase/dihydrofolate synthase family protein [uncultured Dialister sp.]
MNYEESVAYLEQAASFGIKPGLERIEAMLKKLGNPETAYKVIHVTGTNGKGSVVAMITSVLENAQLRVGRYISPHLLDYTERIYICGHDISREDFAKAATVVRKAAEEIIADGVEAPTEFELLTAMAFWYFKEQKVDYAVMEVGMGGLYDSTNVILPVVSVITNVAMDHMKYLGNTLQEIAHQKAGIIKEGIPVVTAAQHVALKQLKKEAHEKKSRIYFYGRDFEIDSRNPWKHGQVVTVKRKDMPKELEKSLLFVPFVGAHQAVNAAVATMALSIIMKQDDRVNENDLREGLARTRWQGRFEIHDVKGVTYIMDGAHNPAGAEALMEALEEQYPDKRRLFVFTSLADKDTETVIQLLIRKGDKVFACEAPIPRTRKPEEIGAMIKAQKIDAAFMAEPSVKAALEDATKEAGAGDIVLICGSLYILGDAIRFIEEKEMEAAKEKK